jgi:hypothetical protein
LEDFEEIDKTLQGFRKCLQRAKFEPGKMENTESCADNAIPAAAKRLLNALALKVPNPN